MDLKRNSLWIIPLLLIISGPLWWPKAADLLAPRGGEPLPAEPSGEKSQAFVLQGVVLTHNEGGTDQFVLRADRVHNSVNEDELQFEGVEAEMVGGDGGRTVLTGGEAFLDTKRQIITLLDNVRVRTASGQTMRTEVLRYLAKFRKVKTAEEVWIGDERFEARGTSLFYDLVSGEFRLGGRVKVDLY